MSALANLFLKHLKILDYIHPHQLSISYNQPKTLSYKFLYTDFLSFIQT